MSLPIHAVGHVCNTKAYVLLRLIWPIVLPFGQVTKLEGEAIRASRFEEEVQRLRRESRKAENKRIEEVRLPLSKNGAFLRFLFSYSPVYYLL